MLLPAQAIVERKAMCLFRPTWARKTSYLHNALLVDVMAFCAFSRAFYHSRTGRRIPQRNPVVLLVDLQRGASRVMDPIFPGRLWQSPDVTIVARVGFR